MARSSGKFHRSRALWLVALGAMVVALVASILILRRGPTLPPPGSAQYEQVTRAFYLGLASLEVGLLDDARQHFALAIDQVGAEPASWANLGLTQLRLGELDAAADPIDRAVSLAPENSDVALLAGRVEIARGRLDEGIAHLRRAVALDPRGLRARFALAEEVERSGLPDAATEAQGLIDAVVEMAPGNLAALLERARLAAARGDAERLRDSLARLEPHTSTWPPFVTEQYQELQAAVGAGNFADAARATALLRNVLARVPAFRESLAAVRTPAELIAEPFDRFLVLAPAVATPAEPDLSLTFTAEPIESAPGPALVVAAFPLNAEGPPALFVADASTVRRIDAAGAWGVPGVAPLTDDAVGPSADSLLPLDWNNDFRTDLMVAGPGGVRLLVQDADGEFTDVTARAGAASPVACDCFGAWAADIEMDGDIDVIVGVNGAASTLLRNSGDGTWRAMPIFDEVIGVRGFAWADLDQDADPDAAFLDAAGVLHVFRNRQAGDFLRIPSPAGATGVIALTAADANADGVIDLLTLDVSGTIRRYSLRDTREDAVDPDWDAQEVATWPDLQMRLKELEPARGSAGAYRLFTADLDNNGALDLIASGPAGTRLWLADETHAFRELPLSLEAEVFAIFDVNDDGRLDLIGLEGGQPVRLIGAGERDYHWKVVRPRAQEVAGDQRINSFGVGGDVEIRSGLLTQKQVLTGAAVHFGLGTRTRIDVARIVWPNGVAQAEFDIGVDDTIVAEQRLKGSCPWVFTYDGSGMQFVTDFLWRSPLGLRINAQDTAGITQTEDWIKIRGDQLAPRNGFYDVRITAELWETHFFDHVSLLVVDRPPGIEVFVDERFSPAAPPAFAVHAMRDPRSVARAWDGTGRDVTELVRRQDGRYLAAFERGAYQGVAPEHFVEFELGDEAPRDRRLTLLAHGWVYPTDSSINVAIGQGSHAPPEGLVLEAQNAAGEWVLVNPDVGYPAGKNKTILIDLGEGAAGRRWRLRTNLEISWDWLAYAEPVEAPLRTTRLQTTRAELRHRGFSDTFSPRGEAPETPLYDSIANTAQRWRDLEGYYTRFGDVQDLLAEVDDRYVIMNAGDELALLFAEQPAPPAGWHRDFVLIGDGWEKDGDYNTSFSQTVLPLPSHRDAEYGVGTTSLALEHDPVYRRHREDWQRYHTRYVAPDGFVRGLRR